MPRFLIYIQNLFMRYRVIVLFAFLSFSIYSKAQMEETYSHEGEYGVSIGLGHYFGDLCPNVKLNHSKFAGGIFYSRQLNNYVSVKASANYADLGYSDAYSKNLVQRERNLSFETNVWEFGVSGNFNFFKFYPEIEEYRFTPYVSVGVGLISFNPFANLNGSKYYLRSLKTEGEANPYSNVTWAAPIGMGVKYNISNKINVFAELLYRFTGTGYLDDVYGTYVGSDPSNSKVFQAAFPTQAAQLLQDRSYEFVNANNPKPRGYTPGIERGNGRNDSYATLQVGISFNLEAYHCPFNATY